MGKYVEDSVCGIHDTTYASHNTKLASILNWDQL